MSKNSYVVSEYIRYNSYNTETYPVHLYFDEEKRAFYIKDWNDKTNDFSNVIYLNNYNFNWLENLINEDNEDLEGDEKNP